MKTLNEVNKSVGFSVTDSIYVSVRDSVWDSVTDSVRYSVWGSVWDSVRDPADEYIRASALNKFKELQNEDSK